MNKQALVLIEKILKSGKFKFEGIHRFDSCENNCIYGLFETVYCALNNQVRINCSSITKRSTEFVLKGVDAVIGQQGMFFLKNRSFDSDPSYAQTKEELLKRLKAL